MPKQKKLKLFIVIPAAFFIVLAIAIFIFFRGRYCLPILMYHMVFPQAESRYRPAVREATFRRQMEFLKKFHYHVISLEEAVKLIREKKKIPPFTVVITFDDGYRDNLEYAFPVLKKYDFPATIFIITDEVGVNPQKLTWDEIKLMQASGLISVGSHCLGPEPLINIKSEAELRRQIFDSKRILEEKLGKKVNYFSYPEGKFDAKIKALVQEAGYLAAVATIPESSTSNWDAFALKRLRISENTSNLFIFALESSGYYTYIKEYKKERKKWKKIRGY